MINSLKFIEIIKENSRVYIDDKTINWDLSLKDDLGIDSIVVIAILAEIENVESIKFSFEALKEANVKSLGDLWRIVNNASNN